MLKSSNISKQNPAQTKNTVDNEIDGAYVFL